MNGKRKSTFGLPLGQLADLFAMATEDQLSAGTDCFSNEGLAKMLHAELTEVMPGNSSIFWAASEISENEQSDITSLTGQSLQGVLSSPKANVSQLKVIKEAGKRLTTSSDSKGERALANVIYHAAIASGLEHHGKKITQHSYNKLDESFALLMEKAWMTEELIELFSQARRICQSKRSRK